MDVSFCLLVRVFQRHAGKSLADERGEKLGNSPPWLLLARPGLTVAGLLCQGPKGLVTTPLVLTPCLGLHCPPRSPITLPTPFVNSPFMEVSTVRPAECAVFHARTLADALGLSPHFTREPAVIPRRQVCYRGQDSDCGIQIRTWWLHHEEVAGVFHFSLCLRAL